MYSVYTRVIYKYICTGSYKFWFLANFFAKPFSCVLSSTSALPPYAALARPLRLGGASAAGGMGGARQGGAGRGVRIRIRTSQPRARLRDVRSTLPRARCRWKKPVRLGRALPWRPDARLGGLQALRAPR